MGRYDNIRPYNDDEVNHYVRLLIKDDVFKGVLEKIFDGNTPKVEHTCQQLSQVTNRKDLQYHFMRPIINDWIINKTTDGITISGLDKLDKSKGYLFISNHRDIILDSAILNVMMVGQGMDSTEIAIGDNLLIYDWIHNLVKLNGAFEVRRNLPVRELLAASKLMSEYIRERISEKNISVWIAQREGRTKDGNDQTQHALLKMLNLSNNKDFTSGFEELNIVPLAISYEREPCGISKVDELYKKETEGFEKTQKDDLMSMVYGLTRPKGGVHFSFGAPIDARSVIDSSANASTNIKLLADAIDTQIYKNYHLYPYNYLAADMLRGKNEYADKVDKGAKDKFNEMLNDLVETIGSGDGERQKEMFLQMYANPLFNKEK